MTASHATNSQAATFDLDRSLTHLMHRVGQCATDAFQRYAGQTQITARQFAVLMAISRMDGASQMDVVKMTGIDRSTLADMISRMLTKGLIERERSKFDGRAYALSLTEAGSAALARSIPAATRADDILLASLPADRRETLLQALNDILKGVDADGEPTPKSSSAP